MAGKYFAKKKPTDTKFTDIVKLYATASTPAQLADSVVFKLANYGYTNEDTIFIKANAAGMPKGWGKSVSDSPLQYNGIDLPFTYKSACPIPKIATSGPIAIEGVYNEVVTYFKYNSDSAIKACQVSTDGKTYETIGSGFTGIFVGLQGGGGGGGGSCYTNHMGITARASGGGGGGAGGFIWAYLDLSAIPDEVVTVTPGEGGSGGESDYEVGLPTNVLVAEPKKGLDGGNTELTYKKQAFLKALGGKGGGVSAISSDDRALGGDGGQTLFQGTAKPDDASLPTWITILNYYYGKAGGHAGNPKGQFFGITGSNNFGDDGGSFITSDTINLPFLKTSPYVLRDGEWISGKGGDNFAPELFGDSFWLSGGGGGGASVMCRSKGIEMKGYGGGGHGGAATTSALADAGNGNKGCVFWATP